MRTLKGLLLLTRVGLNFEVSPPRPHDEGPPNVDEGVASVDAVLAELNTDDMLDDVLVLPDGLVTGVCVRGRLRYASSRRAAPGRRSMKSS